MILIEEYIKLDKTKRQEHLRLDDPCIERGGPTNGGLSSYCKGLMSHVMDTTIPSGHTIHVCHACNNAKCSNPNHLYWGTAKENREDQIAVGDLTIWERTVVKYGLEEARRMASERSNKDSCSKGGKAGKGKPKSEEQKKKIAASMLGKRNAKKIEAR